MLASAMLENPDGKGCHIKHTLVFSISQKCMKLFGEPYSGHCVPCSGFCVPSVQKQEIRATTEAAFAAA